MCRTLAGPLWILTSRTKKHSMGSGCDWFTVSREPWSDWVLLPSLLLLPCQRIPLLCQLSLQFLFPKLLLCLFLLQGLLLGKSCFKSIASFCSLRVGQLLLCKFHGLLVLMLCPRHLSVMLLSLHDECPLQFLHFVCLLML